MLCVKRVSLRTVVLATAASVVLLGAILAWRRGPLLPLRGSRVEIHRSPRGRARSCARSPFRSATAD